MGEILTPLTLSEINNLCDIHEDYFLTRPYQQSFYDYLDENIKAICNHWESRKDEITKNTYLFRCYSQDLNYLSALKKAKKSYADYSLVFV